jgi:hypothetical protein
MSLTAFTLRPRWVVSLLLVQCVACSATPHSALAPRRTNNETAQTPKPGGAAGMGGASGTPDQTDNPDNPTSPTVPMAMPMNMAAGTGPAAGSGAANSGAAGDGCEVGKFCPNMEPDPTDCGKLELKTETKMVLKPGNVMVVFDRSGSMEADWSGMPKYQAATAAITAAIMPLKDMLTVGGVFFPSAPTAGSMDCPDGCNVANPLHWIPGPGACCLNGVAGSCDVNTIDKPDEINWTSADLFITALPMQSHLNGANGTPLEGGVTRAAEAIKGKTFDNPLVVIVMTDGEPNCNTNTMNVLNQISMWKAANITTYVVGLPGAQAAADVLNMLAMAGGTDKYIDPANPAELEMRLRDVISSTVRAGFENCTFHLDPKAEAPNKLHLIATQNGMDADIPRDWSKDAHWKINSEGNQVDLEGQLCDMAKDGTFEALRFVYGCVDVPPPPPPPPPPMLN